MANPKNKKVEEKPAPVISKLPIPISDSPLVIDLPDGQKLVVGKMIQGTVIEVATWRGTGRPDSRTSRLMLGMSVGEVNPTPEPPATNPDGAPAAPSAPARPVRKKSSNPRISQLQEVLFAVIDHPIYKKLFAKPEPKAPRKKSEVVATSDQATTVESKAPAEPLSPFAAPAPKAAKKGLLAKLFGPSPQKARKAKAPKVGKKFAPAPSVTTIKGGKASEVDDISAWLDEISNKAKAKVDGTTATKPAKKAAPAAKKTAKPVKKAAAVAKKRK